MTDAELKSYDQIEGSSNRDFGFVFTAFFALVALYPLIHGRSMRLWSVGLSVGFLAVTLIRADLLAPLNWAWTKLAFLLSRVSNTVILGLLFFVGFSLFGLVSRLRGGDALALRKDPDAKSYWLERDPPGPDPQTMLRQY